jgi:acetylornithine deacetylase/succinyl-diaminopimelate desuccinylase-like protein
MDTSRARQLIDDVWDSSIIPTLVEYVRIPNKSPAFDAQWAEHGYMDEAITLAENWVREHAPSDASIQVVRLPGRTPVLLIDVPGTAPGNVLLYGHLDKQPEMVGWDDDLGPWKPVLRDGKLYGRGGADDGYAVFASLTAINVLRDQDVPHARALILIETCEESGSFDLPFYIDHLTDTIGTPELVICLDSGAGNYEQLWMTTSLRGMIGGTLQVDVLKEGVHSGDASGVVASSFRVARALLDRIEDSSTGTMHIEACNVEIPSQRVEQAQAAAEVLGGVVSDRFPWVEGMGPVTQDRAEIVLNRTWRPTLSITGAAGLPSLQDAGSVLRPGTALKLSFRLPPTVDASVAYAAVKEELERESPYGAQVSFEGSGESGWHAPILSPWLADALNGASMAWFGRPSMQMGEGGTIPFMGMLGEKFPDAQFVITGVLGPGSNAHGPNEFLHLGMAKNLTGCMAHVMAIHAKRTL